MMTTSLFKRAVLGAALVFALALSVCGQTPIVFEPMRPSVAPAMLGTMKYEPTSVEKPILEALPLEEQRFNILLDRYDLAERAGKNIAWFGVVRKIEEDADRNTTRLLVEHKHTTGLRDLHQQVVSAHGSGDFEVELSGRGLGLRLLALVRVYGRVAKSADGPPRVEAVTFVRHWDWGSWAFIGALGPDASNPEWKKLSTMTDNDRVYSANPGPSYYRKRLGARPEIPGEVHAFTFLEGDQKSGRAQSYRDAKGVDLSHEEFLTHLLNHGVRRRSTWVPADFARSRTTLEISVSADSLASASMGMSIFGARRDIGINRVYLKRAGSEDAAFRWRNHDVPHPNVELRLQPGILIDGPKRGKGASKPKKGKLRRRLVPTLEDEPKKIIKPGELEEVLADLLKKDAKVLTVFYKGQVPMGEIFEVAEAARAAGFAEVELAGERMMPRFMRWDLFGRSGASKPMSQEDLEAVVGGKVQSWARTSDDDMLWFGRRRGPSENGEKKDDAKTRAKSSERLAASALTLAAASLFGQLDADAAERDRFTESLDALVEGLASLSVKRSDPLRPLAWLAFGLVRTQSFVFNDDLEEPLSALMVRLKNARLAGGGWPKRIGDTEPDLEVSALVAMAAVEAKELELPGMDAWKLGGRAGWLAVRTEVETGFVAVVPGDGLAASFSSVDRERMMRTIHGDHAEQLTALSAICRLVAGEKVDQGVLRRQLERVREIPPTGSVATMQFDSLQLLFCSWLLAHADLSSWSELPGQLRAAIGEHIERRRPLDESNVPLVGGMSLTWVRMALSTALLREYEPGEK